jgi:hypothetical protein
MKISRPDAFFAPAAFEDSWRGESVIPVKTKLLIVRLYTATLWIVGGGVVWERK